MRERAAMRATSNNFHLIRLLAASQVMLIHASIHAHLGNLPMWMIPIVDSFPGVPIFFVVSGFLVTRSFFEGEGGTFGFFMRRALRIYPGLWTHYIIVMAAFAVTGALTVKILFSLDLWKWIAASFFFGADFWGNLYINRFPFLTDGLYKYYPSGVLWTISVELGFYVLVPIVFLRLFRDLRVAWLPIIVFAAASFYFAHILDQSVQINPNLNFTAELKASPLPYFWVFLIGATMSVYWRYLRPFFAGRFVLWLAAYYLITKCDMYFFQKQTIDLDHFVGLTVPRMFVLAGLVISFAYTLPVLSRRIKADLSYATYLYHMPLILTLAGLGIVGHWWLYPVIFAGTFAIAAASWYLVEKPALSAKRFSAVGARALETAFRKLLGFTDTKAPDKPVTGTTTMFKVVGSWALATGCGKLLGFGDTKTPDEPVAW
jgi:peptidoglycan/LPS O-acetylase OafA/YrhL